MIVKNNIINLLNLLLDKSLQNEMDYLKILKYTENYEMLELLDNRHEASCLRVLALKESFLDENIADNYEQNHKKEATFGWLNVKSILMKETRNEIFREILKAEKKCLSDYNDLLEKRGIPKKIGLLLNQQKIGIELSIINLNLSK